MMMRMMMKMRSMMRVMMRCIPQFPRLSHGFSPPLKLTCCKAQSCGVGTSPYTSEILPFTAALKRTNSYLSTFISASCAHLLHTDSKVSTLNLEPKSHFIGYSCNFVILF